MERALGAALASFVFPGFGHGMTRRRWPTIVWSALGLFPLVLIVVSVWMAYLAVLVRIVGSVISFRLVQREAESADWFGALPAIAVVVGSVALGYAELAIDSFRIPSSSMCPTIVIGDRLYVDTLTTRWRTPERGEVIVFRYPCAPERAFIKRVVAVGGDTVELRCNVLYVNGKAVASELVDKNVAYNDRDEATGAWYARVASRYRETLDGRSYETFHDADRPLRDAHRDTLTVGDTRDFPQRDFPPSCHASEFYPGRATDPQPVGKIIETKPRDRAHPCDLQAHFVVPADSFFTLGDNRSNANDSRVWGAVANSAVIGRAIGIWISSGEHGLDMSRVGAVR